MHKRRFFAHLAAVGLFALAAGQAPVFAQSQTPDALVRQVSSEVMGQDADALPLPRRLRALALRVVPESYLIRAQARRGAFIFLRASQPV